LKKVKLDIEGHESSGALIIRRESNGDIICRDGDQFWAHGEKELIEKCLKENCFWEALAKHCLPENYDLACETYFLLEKKGDGTYETETGFKVLVIE
jgi:hypothetical protein